MSSTVFFPVAGSTLVIGTAQNDVLVGYTGNDTLRGSAGDDVFFEGTQIWSAPNQGPFVTGEQYDFGAGNDVLNGGLGFDTVDYSNRALGIRLNLNAGTATSGTEVDSLVGIEEVIFSRGDDLVVGAGTIRFFFLNDGNDTIRFQDGMVVVSGGYGIDRLDLSDVLAPVIYNTELGVDTAALYIEGFEHIVGSRTAKNHLTGGSESNLLVGGSQSDSLFGSYSNDSLYGGDGNDRLFGGSEDDRIETGNGNDKVYGGDGRDVIINDGGSDFVYGGDGQDTIYGHSSADKIFGGVASILWDEPGDLIFGGGGNDTLQATDLNSTVYGGSGDDKILGRGQLEGGHGNDTLTSDTDYVFATKMYGQSGDDLFNISRSDVTSYGGSGSDTFIGALGTLYGGTGNDFVSSKAQSFDSVYAYLGGGDDRVSLSETGAIEVHGEDGNDRISLGFVYTGAFGGSGDDWITTRVGMIDGGDGNDTLSIFDGEYDFDSGTIFAGSGNDLVIFGDEDAADESWGRFAALGGSGDDTLVIWQGSILVSDQPVYEPDILTGADVLTTVSGFEQIVVASADAIVRYLREDSDLVFGGTNDILRISTSDQSYDMGAGNDTITLNAAAVTLFGGSGDDRIDEVFRANLDGFVIETGDGNDSVTLHGDGAISTGAGNDYIQVWNSVTIDAGSGDDRAVFANVGLLYQGSILVEVITEGKTANAVANMGAGNDTVLISSPTRQVALGEGDDFIVFLSHRLGTTEVSGGEGADHFQFMHNWTRVSARIVDFDVSSDRLALGGITSLASIDKIETFGNGVRLTEGNWSIQLSHVAVTDLTDSILAPLLFF